ncbi:MAG: YybH family protein [Steroidobacteraceae bacterium]
MNRYALTLLGLWSLAQVPLAEARDLCGAANRAALQTDQRAVCEHADEWVRRFTARDLDGLMQLYVPDAVVALHGQPMMEGLPSVRAYFAKSMPAAKSVQFELDVERIEIHGDIVHFLSRYWFTSTREDNSTLRDAGRSLLIYKRDSTVTGAGHWKIALDIDQNTPDVVFPAPSERR